MSATTGGGGIGGVFAPSLFIGGGYRLFMSRLINFFESSRLPESNFALAGMAGVMAAVMACGPSRLYSSLLRSQEDMHSSFR
jgi:CIC family chloride channel protein